MMPALFAGVSGLRAHQQKMDVIGNNIANVNTYGYKAQRATFSDMFYQSLSGASAADSASGRGGKNGMQIGMGTQIGSIDSLMGRGSTESTGNSTLPSMETVSSLSGMAKRVPICLRGQATLA